MKKSRENHKENPAGNENYYQTKMAECFIKIGRKKTNISFPILWEKEIKKISVGWVRGGGHKKKVDRKKTMEKEKKWGQCRSKEQKKKW